MQDKTAKSNIVKVRCFHFWSDWTDINKIEIDLEKYVFFEIDYRGSWHIKGHKCDENYKWTVEELSDHGVVSALDLAEFIVSANTYNPYQRCKVSRFNNLHYYGGFYEELQKLLGLVAEKAAAKAAANDQTKAPLILE